MTLLHLSTHLNGFHLIHPQSPRLSSISPVSVSLASIPHRTQFQSLVLCARRRRKRGGHGRTARLLFKSLSLLSTNLQILPQPLDLVIADLGGGRGGGGGGGGGGGDGRGLWRGWGRFDGWRRKRNRVPILILVCVMLWIYGYCKVSGKVIKSDEILKVLGACVLGISLVKELKREARSLVFVFLSLIASFVFGFKKESLVKLASQVRSCSSSALLTKTRSRRRV